MSGLGHVPRIGPVILAANHLGFLDSFVLPLMVPRRVHFLGKHEYFTGAGMKGRATATFFHSVGAIAVDRSGGRAALDALDTSAAVLERGGVFAIHPEGTRSPTGGSTGAGRAWRGSRCGPARPSSRWRSRAPTRCSRAGRPSPARPDRAAHRRADGLQGTGRGVPRGKAARQVTDEIMEAIQRLSGQEYVDDYAPRPDGPR